MKAQICGTFMRRRVNTSVGPRENKHKKRRQRCLPSTAPRIFHQGPKHMEHFVRKSAQSSIVQRDSDQSENISDTYALKRREGPCHST
jgi:hypothetical protein